MLIEVIWAGMSVQQTYTAGKNTHCALYNYHVVFQYKLTNSVSVSWILGYFKNLCWTSKLFKCG